MWSKSELYGVGVKMFAQGHLKTEQQGMWDVIARKPQSLSWLLDFPKIASTSQATAVPPQQVILD